MKQNPGVVQGLQAFLTTVAHIDQSRIQVLPVPSSLVVAATVISRQTGLLSNDALILAVMQAHGLSKLASNDADFDRVPGITRYAPA